MHANQSLWTARNGWAGTSNGLAGLLLAFGNGGVMANPDIGDGIPITGFYSYSEVKPQESAHCKELHNQTVTTTMFGEAHGA